MPMRLEIGDVCLVVGAERICERAPAGVIGGELGWRLKKAAGGRSSVAMALALYTVFMRCCGCVRLVGWLRANCGSVGNKDSVRRTFC